jgi:hypothetical protein
MLNSKGLRSLSAVLALAVMDAAPSKAVDFQPFDYVPAPPGTNILFKSACRVGLGWTDPASASSFRLLQGHRYPGLVLARSGSRAVEPTALQSPRGLSQSLPIPYR